MPSPSDALEITRLATNSTDGAAAEELYTIRVVMNNDLYAI